MDNIKLGDTDIDEISQTIKNKGIEGFKFTNEQIAVIGNVIESQKQKVNQYTPKRKLNVGQSYEDLEKEIAKLEAIPDIKTGFIELDQKLKFSAGTLSVIYAYSGHGKTSFMLKLMQSFMSKNSPSKVACMYILFEDASPRIKQRFKNTFIKSESAYQARMKINAYSEANSYCFEHAYEGEDALCVEHLEAELIAPFKALNKNKTIVVFIDYIQQIDIKDKRQSGYDKMKTISKELKRIASIKGEEIIVIAGAQENKEGGLREADDIRQSADNIINLYNVSAAEAELDKAIKKRQLTPEIENTANELKEKNKSLVLLHVVKSRNTNGKGACDNVFSFDGNNFVENYLDGFKYKEFTQAYGTGNIPSQIKRTLSTG